MIRKLISLLTNRNNSPAAPQPLCIENLEERQMLSVVSIFAQGTTGDETLQVQIDTNRGFRPVAEISSLPTDGFQEYQFDFNENLTASDIRLVFLNDLYDPANGVDRNIIVDRIEVDGTIYETENAETFSTGTWRSEDGVISGTGRGDTLHTNGFLNYSNNGAGGVADTTLISVDVESSVTRPIGGALPADPTMFEIQIDGQTVRQFQVSGESGFNQDVVNFRARGDIAPERIRVAFTNDAVFTEPVTGQTVDRNLTVRSITVDGFQFDGSNQNVLSTGTYLAGDGITAGLGRGTTLHANGFFQYVGAQQTTEIVIDARGFGDVVDFELQIDGQAVQSYSLSARAGQSERVFVFNADGIISPDRVRIAFVNDLIFTDPISGATIDRNLQIKSVRIGDETLYPGLSNVFSTGTYLAEDGVTPGFGRGNFLHANGYFQFG